MFQITKENIDVIFSQYSSWLAFTDDFSREYCENIVGNFFQSPDGTADFYHGIATGIEMIMRNLQTEIEALDKEWVEDPVIDIVKVIALALLDKACKLWVTESMMEEL